ncbi:MAG: tRNA-dihydrouridine synthase, partial [Pseudomonadota bacterium]
PTVIARIARDVPEIGFLTTKTIGLEPREGYREPILHEYYPGCFVNAVGLANPGALNFLRAMLPLMPLHGDKPLVVSIMGANAEEFLECARILQPIADAFELNLSCPHVKGAGQSVGSDPDTVRSIIGLLKEHLDKPIIPKLSPNLADIPGMARLCRDAGAAALCLINTVGPGTAVDVDGSPILTNVSGGLSGAGIRPVGLKAVREAASAVDLPVIAVGGIGCADDVRAYRQAGASLYGVGSALAGMTTPQIAGFFARLGQSLKREPEPCSPSKCLAGAGRTAYFKTTVTANEPFGPDLFKLSLRDGPACDPGRFFFLRLPGIGEKPFSPARDMEPAYLIRAVGPFTRALKDLKPGDSLFMRGPYGQGFPRPDAGSRLVLLAGGTGAAPVMMALTRWKELAVRAFFGFSAPIEPWFQDEILGSRSGSSSGSLHPDVRVVIDSPDHVGEVVRALEEDVVSNPTLYAECRVFVCGPGPMMRAAVTVLENNVSKDHIFLAREDIMRCGIGVCGSCGTGTGLRSCVDGPVMQAE